MPFYTFVFDYVGGTYVSQVEARDEKAACLEWAFRLDLPEIAGFGIKEQEALINELEKTSPVALKGLQNAWCVTALLGDRPALAHLIKTEIPTNGRPPRDN